jgi:hypothetical protein
VHKAFRATQAQQVQQVHKAFRELLVFKVQLAFKAVMVPQVAQV